MMVRILHGVLIAVVLAVSLVVAPTPASAAEITVGVDGCTLADAIVAANTDEEAGQCVAGSGADTIVLGNGEIYTLDTVVPDPTGRGRTGLPAITSDITIEGNGSTIQRDTTKESFRLLLHTGGALTLRDLTFRDGVADAGSTGSWGGCILSRSRTPLTVIRSTFTACGSAINGQAIAANHLVIDGSTFYHNRTAGPPTIQAVIRVDVAGAETLTMTNSTVHDNDGNGVVIVGRGTEGSAFLNGVTIAGDTEASIWAQGNGHFQVKNSILVPLGVVADEWSSINDLGGNIMSGDPMLGPLANNGGPTLTRAPLPGSPAIDGGLSADCLATDQRGNDRDLGGLGCDIGAVEILATAPVLTLPTVAPVEATGPTGAAVSYTATAVDYAGDPASVVCNPASGDTFAIQTTTVSCTATDALDQETTDTFSITVQDTIAPETTAAATNPDGVPYASDDWTSQNVDVLFQATDSGSGVDRIILEEVTSLGTYTSITYGSSTTLSVTTEGTSSISYRAVDEAGNTETAKTFVVKIDKTDPSTTVTALTNPGNTTYESDTWTSQQVDLTFNTADGAGSGFDHLSVARSLNGGTPTPVTIGNGGTLSITDEGITTVTYQATDGADNQEALQTFIVKIDRSAPSITAPANITVNATSPDGAVVTYPAPVVSDTLTTVVTNCDPASGSLFPVGTTTVTCTATDEADNEAQTTFTVRVIGADQLLDDLATAVQQVPISGDASTATSIRRNMLAMVALADGFEASGADSAACLMLTRLELEVRAQVSKRRIVTRDAQPLWAKIDEVQAAVGCGGTAS